MTEKQKNPEAEETGSGSGCESGSTNENGHGVFLNQEYQEKTRGFN